MPPSQLQIKVANDIAMMLLAQQICAGRSSGVRTWLFSWRCVGRCIVQPPSYNYVALHTRLFRRGAVVI
jgi:hypothetical protein